MSELTKYCKYQWVQCVEERKATQDAMYCQFYWEGGLKEVKDMKY